MNVLGRCAASGIFLFAALFPLVGGAAPACAAETPRAVLVVDTGESEHRFCVSLPAEEVSGIQLIELAADQHGLSYKLGYGGGAVCMLAGVGPTGDDCFEDHPNFWGYWRGDGSGGWVWSSSGAGSTRVGDGDVEGWSWGSGSNGDTHQRPPATTFGDVCAQEAKPPRETAAKAGREEEPPARRSSGGGRQRVSQPAPGPAAPVPADRPAPQLPAKEPRAGANRPRKQDEPEPGTWGSETPAATDESPSALALDQQATSTREPADSPGPPAAGMAALGAAALLGGAGLVLARRRRARS